MQQSKAKIDHAVVDVLIVDGDKFLLVQEGKPGRNGTYNLPGGHVEANETLFEAAIREVKEETGYDIKLTGLVGIYQSVFPHINISGPVFSGTIVSGTATTTAEHPAIRWVTRDEVHQMARDGELFTTYPPYAVDHYQSRGSVALDIVASYVH